MTFLKISHFYNVGYLSSERIKMKMHRARKEKVGWQKKISKNGDGLKL
jgi:hypothetical protein